MSFEIGNVALLQDSDFEKKAVEKALAKFKQLQKALLKVAKVKNVEIPITTKQFNKIHPVGSYFLDPQGDLVQTRELAKSRKVLVDYVPTPYQTRGWDTLNIKTLTQPKYLAILFEWLNDESPTSNTCDVTTSEFEILTAVCDNSGLCYRSPECICGDASISIEKDKKRLVFYNIDFIEPEADQYDDDDLSWLKGGNCRD
jgi:hypothetical protein